MEIQNEQNKSVTMQIRADEQTKEQFAEICKSLGMTQGAAMQQLIHAYELEQAKGALVGSADVIDDIRSHMDAVVNAFLVQLEHNANTDSRVRADYEAQLQTLTATCRTLTTQTQHAQDVVTQMQQEMDEYKERAEQESKDAATQVAMYMEQAERAVQAYHDAEQSTANATRAIDALTKQLDSLTAERDRLLADANRADELAEELALAKAKNIELQTAAEVATAKAEAEQAKAVDAVRQEMQAKLDAVQKTAQEKQDELRNKLDATKDELAAVKDKLHRAQLVQQQAGSAEEKVAEVSGEH